MAIIQYGLNEIGDDPSGISDGGHYIDITDAYRIGIGTGCGSEITKAILLEYVLARVSLQNDDGSEMNDSQKTTNVNAWCTARGIS
jgi:hypothetical protein|tara:strand:+ start:2765 stop:3022 length:258 start_codon:yes stop_codon:yes gene_type:complete